MSLAQQVLAKYGDLFQRADIKAALPGALEELKKPETQALLSPALIAAAVANPDLLTGQVPAEFITLLKEDAAVSRCVQ